PLLLTVANGTLVLGSRKRGDAIRLRPHDRADLITCLAGTAFDPDAGCPTFLEFLDQAQPDPDIRLFLQTWHGYGLTGWIHEQCIVLNHGTGSNGKSTFFGPIVEAMGDYAASPSIDVF